MIKKFGLIGKSLTHSFSKTYFEDKFKNENIESCSYMLFELSNINDIKKLVNDNNLNGFNVTIPFKESIIPFIDELSDEAKAIGAVNTVLVKNNRLIGHNTDAFGFKQSVKPFIKNHHERVLILGTGGAAKAVDYVLQEMGINTLFVSRTPNAKQINYEQISEYVIKYHYLIINCSPVGMFPNIDKKPNIPYNYLTEKHTLIDLIYNPTATEFLKEGKKRGCDVLNGLSMLQQQAEQSWRIWNS
jgi:shikimate dehydrogenase